MKSMKYLRRLIFLLMFLPLFVFCFAPKAFAASEQIDSFTSNIVAHQNGTMTVTEAINYSFGDSEKHGIFRTIPLSSKVGNLYRQMTITVQSVSRDGRSEPFTTTTSNDVLTIKIGNPAATITGTHLYTLVYVVGNGIGSNYAEHDEIYWNATGNSWAVPILSASASVGTDFDGEATKAACYTGAVGSTTSDCAVPETPPFAPITTTKPLNSNEGLTVVYAFPVNTFPKSVLSKTPPNGTQLTKAQVKVILFAIFILYFLLPIVLLVWFFFFRHRAKLGKPAVNFDLPADTKGNRIAPAEAGMIDTAQIERNDVTATIFDLAIRKYLKIEQITTEETTLGILHHTDTDYRLVKLHNNSGLTPFEKILFNRLFTDSDTVLLSDLKSDFYSTYQAMGSAAFQSLISRGFYSDNPTLKRGLFAALAGVSLVMGNLLLFGVFLVFRKNLINRTSAGDKADWQIDGLKIFLKAMSRNYKWQAEQLYIVEKMIPYAMALGYISQYMEALKVAKPDYTPEWYSGTTPFYTATPFLFSAFSTNLTTTAPSSSSGFGGGGFSGGGGGGGGGGSW